MINAVANIDLSVVLATYNQSKDLELSLESLLGQKFVSFELLLADDGSDEETRRVIKRYEERFQGRLKHLWQEDQGFRKAKILNQSIRESRADYLVFGDADILYHPMFLQDHFGFKKKMGLFKGRRVDLGKVASAWVRQNPSKLFNREFYRKLCCGDSGTRHLKRAFRVESPWIRKLLKSDRVPDLLGSNFSVDKSLLEKINGFDENYKHYGVEDGDLYIRARNAGAVESGTKNLAIQFHLWHPRRKFLPGAEEDYNRRLQEDHQSKACLEGLRKKLSTS